MLWFELQIGLLETMKTLPPYNNLKKNPEKITIDCRPILRRLVNPNLSFVLYGDCNTHM
jgi:hypothetical protein